MSEYNHDHHNPKQQQAQDAVPHEQLHVNGAGDGPVSPASTGKGGGNKSPPGNGKAPPPGNGAEGGRSLLERVASLETEHKHLATKADLEKGLRVTKEDLTEKLHATELRLVEKIQENKEELQAEMRKMPARIVVGMAGLVTIVSGLAGLIYWLQGVFG